MQKLYMFIGNLVLIHLFDTYTLFQILLGQMCLRCIQMFLYLIYLYKTFGIISIICKKRNRQQTKISIIKLKALSQSEVQFMNSSCFSIFPSSLQQPPSYAFNFYDITNFWAQIPKGLCGALYPLLISLNITTSNSIMLL